MKLFPKDIEKNLFKQFHLGADLERQVVVTKIFNPYSDMRWFLINSDSDDTDYIWAIVQMGDNVEVGSVSRSELESVRVTRFRLPLERDLSFRPVNAAELYRGLKQGKFYKKGGFVDNENKEMAENQATEVKHHSEELSSALKKTDHVEAWVVGKMERATTDLSDVTHYLDGESKKMENGGGVYVPKERDKVMFEGNEYTIIKITNENVRGLIDTKWHLYSSKVGVGELILDSPKGITKMEKGGYMAKGGKLKVGDTIYRAWFTDEDGEKGSAIIVATSQKNAERIATKIYADRFSYVSNPIKIKNEEVLFEESREKEPIYKMADGGKIKDQYEGRTSSDIWDNLSKQQRQHFLYDHKEDIEDYRGEEFEDLSGKEILKAYNSDWKDLDKNIKNRFENHIREGEYAYGGYMAQGGILNKNVNQLLKDYLKDSSASPMHQWMVKKILKSALTDANFHSEAKKVDDIFPNAKFTESAQYSKLQEDFIENRLEEKGREIAKMSEWDGDGIIDSIAFYVSMNMGRPLGKKVESLKDDEMAKGGKLIGKQYKLDKNKNGKLDKDDFKMIRGKMEKGGMSNKKSTFADKVKAISTRLKGKKVPTKLKKDYGKTYDKKESVKAAQRIVGSMVKKEKLKNK